jgi:hypothetical protein
MSRDEAGPSPDLTGGKGLQFGSGNVQVNHYYGSQAQADGVGTLAAPANDLSKAVHHGRNSVTAGVAGTLAGPTVLGGIRGEGALLRARFCGEMAFLSFGVLSLVTVFLSFRTGHRYLQLPWGAVRQTFVTDVTFVYLVGFVIALGFAVPIYLLGLGGKTDTFAFDQEALTIRDRAWATTGVGQISIRWDSAERITVERKPHYGAFRYTIITWFRPGGEPSPALLRKYGGWLMRYGGRQRQDGSYVVYRSGYWHHRGAGLSRLMETFRKYAGPLYVDPSDPSSR